MLRPMWSFRRKGARADGSATAVAEPAEVQFAEFEGSDEQLREEIERLSASCRAERDPVLERELVRLRHLMGIRLLDAAPSDPIHPDPDYALLANGTVLAEVSPGQLTPELLRAAILRHGCLPVRGLVDRD